MAWFKGLLAAILGGAVTAVAASVANGAPLNSTTVRGAAIGGAATTVLAYFKSPPEKGR